MSEPVSETPGAKTTDGWLERLRAGLSRTSSALDDGIANIFGRHKLDDETLEKLEDLLITADLGPATAARLTAHLARGRFDEEVAPADVRAALAEDIAQILAPVATPLKIDPARKPHVILVVGVNGSGKTT
ncbi:MAG: signal recognition particle receptor subunit alpha, partial [Alphaproteobacteria bacterium]